MYSQNCQDLEISNLQIFNTYDDANDVGDNMGKNNDENYKHHLIRGKPLEMRDFGDRFPKIPIPWEKLIKCSIAPHNLM